jgi:hypothetical protein
MADDEPERNCLDCGYSLRGLTVARCPECGRAFDPSDGATYATQTGSPELALFLRQPPGIALYALCGLSLIFALLRHFNSHRVGTLTVVTVALGLWVIAFTVFTIRILTLILTLMFYPRLNAQDVYQDFFTGSLMRWLGVPIVLVVALLVLMR